MVIFREVWNSADCTGSPDSSAPVISGKNIQVETFYSGTDYRAVIGSNASVIFKKDIVVVAISHTKPFHQSCGVIVIFLPFLKFIFFVFFFQRVRACLFV
eukprot:GHVR01094411.1.p1 GENE.GHVR01094411.1~~GHVR01094411.1.p1  ORF type:complete len:100 (+),score=13.50 GHVR01094411.1:326-625(+)